MIRRAFRSAAITALNAAASLAEAWLDSRPERPIPYRLTDEAREYHAIRCEEVEDAARDYAVASTTDDWNEWECGPTVPEPRRVR